LSFLIILIRVLSYVNVELAKRHVFRCFAVNQVGLLSLFHLLSPCMDLAPKHFPVSTHHQDIAFGPLIDKTNVNISHFVSLS
jgi:hypothetical protein